MGRLLGYVFWHRPLSGIPPGEYERKLLAFQASLKSHRPEGLVDALSFRLGSLPWSKRRSGGYEDWYLVDDFKSLGVLNDAAVANPNKTPHDDIARDAAGGAGGIYRMLKGDLPLREAGFAMWMRKSAQTPYQVFLDELASLVADKKTDLWRRQMVLGPAPEFCLHTEGRFEIPSSFRATAVGVELVAAGRMTVAKGRAKELDGS